MMRPDANKGRDAGGLQLLAEGVPGRPTLPPGCENAIFSFDT